MGTPSGDLGRWETGRILGILEVDTGRVLGISEIWDVNNRRYFFVCTFVIIWHFVSK